MHITFTVPDDAHMISSILDFQREGESSFWSDPLYHFYPQLDRDYALSLPFSERLAYLTDALHVLCRELAPVMNEKATLYNVRWNEVRAQVTQALSDAFSIDCAQEFNDIRAFVSINPIMPRFLDTNRFDVFYLNSPDGAIGMSLHEVIHFLWFRVWNTLFGDSFEEYERPSLKWILSEMVVEPIMRDVRLSSLNPYFPRENGGCVYPYFYDMLIEDRPILDTLDKLYRAYNIQDFMHESYAYCLAHEREIRAHMERAEQNR